MRLLDLLEGVSYEVVCGDVLVDVCSICYDSRCYECGDVFVALIGIDNDGHNYIQDVIDKGCRCVIVCSDVDINTDDVVVIRVGDTREVLSCLSENLFGHPAFSLVKIGITGTKGKTSVSYMISSVLECAGYKVGVIGTLGTVIDGVVYEHKNTTPESFLIQKYMREMVDAGCTFVVMEVSSQALKVGRVRNIWFDYAIFTNLSLDHIGSREHESFDDYKYCKSKLFKMCDVGIFNCDDEYYDDMIRGACCKIYNYGSVKGDLVGFDVRYYSDDEGLGIEFDTKGVVCDRFLVRALGMFSSYNAMSVILLSYILGIDMRYVKEGLWKFSVRGRCEIYSLPFGVSVVIDFAHNKVSMESIIKVMREYNKGRVVCVFGCGGGRSVDRRRELGEVSGRYADMSIVTMDNPRWDDVCEINRDIVLGIESVGGKYMVISDREKAIRYAIENAKSGDIILLLGKGHESFQEVRGVVYDFDERSIVLEYV